MGITYSYYIKLFYSPFLKLKFNGLNGQKQKKKKKKKKKDKLKF